MRPSVCTADARLYCPLFVHRLALRTIATRENAGPPTMKQTLPIAASLALAVFATPALAQGDAENGKLLAYTCTGCHGIPGYKNAYPSYRVPKIGGQNYEYLVTALMAYKNNQRPHPTMRAQAESFTDQEIRDIATYLASLADGGAK